ncbi:hypothetical protein EV127DRAFT_253857 [Xylaria flabelliformis]|nr:hypothetical protein EV127DRAFT_253857 [Xylaria flabelliformis]
MDPPLRDKQAFFAQLDACRDLDDQSDVLSTEEQLLRQRSRAFSLAAAAPVSLPSSLKQKLRPRRIASDPIPRLSGQEFGIIVSSTSVYGASATKSVIPETEQHLRLLRSQSDLEPSPSITMPKRKRDPPQLKMVPESRQIFKGLRFYYLPDDDIDPARKAKITKAREHGATWVREAHVATHIIVDEWLTLGAVIKFLKYELFMSSVIIVNEKFPIDCTRRRELIDPYETVELRRYEVTNSREDEPSLNPDPEEHREIKSSLRDKLPKYDTPAANLTSQSSQENSDLIPSSYPEGVQSSSKSGDVTESPILADELTTCIDAILADPEKHGYLDESDSDTRVSEDEGPSKRRGKGRQPPRQNDVNTGFGKDKFMCMRGGTKDKKASGPNAHTIKLFEEMAEEHRLSDEHWRVQSYRKAVATLRRQTKKITTAKQAAALPNIGSSLASHIEEIATTGRFAKLDNIRNEPSREALKLFCNVYGVGVPTAQRWVELGYRTLDDLRTKATLTTNQQLGVDHYDDLLTRIPRAEVKALGDHVKDVAATIDPRIELIIGGSYRRGAESSGDIDMIVTKDGSSSTQDLSGFLDNIVETLTKQGFLTAAVASHRHAGGNKWHGCCVLPKAAFPGPKESYRPIWRRIDFLLVPQTEIGAALVYFTGNDLFNRSMRLLARKKGMRLNHRALSGAGVYEGRDEKKIFEILGVQWREPHERWC